MSILTDGYPSIEEIKEATGWPDEERFAKGPVAIIECVQKIPCNPCEAACPAHAITVGNPITNTPVLDREKCIGCGVCTKACPNHLIFVDETGKAAKCDGCIARRKAGREPACLAVCCLDAITVGE